MVMKKILFILIATAALQGWGASVTVTYDYTTESSLLAMGFYESEISTSYSNLVNNQFKGLSDKYASMRYEHFMLWSDAMSSSVSTYLLYLSTARASQSQFGENWGGSVVCQARPMYMIKYVSVESESENNVDRIEISAGGTGLNPTVSGAEAFCNFPDGVSEFTISGEQSAITRITVIYDDNEAAYDFDGNGKVDPDDGNYFLKNYMMNGGSHFDINGDGRWNLVDYVYFLNYLFNSPIQLDIASYYGKGDVNEDGVVDNDDYDDVYDFVIDYRNAEENWVCSSSDSSYDITDDGRCDSWDLVILRLLIDVVAKYDLNGDGKVDPDDLNYMLPGFVDGNFPSGSDFNNNEIINVTDAAMLYDYLLTNPTGMDITPYIGHGDVNGDGAINEEDLDLVSAFVMNPTHIRNDWVCRKQYASYDITGDNRCDSWDWVILAMLIGNGYTTIYDVYDVNHDGKVDPDDANYFLQHYYDGTIDIDGDGDQDFFDYNDLLQHFRTNPMNMDITPYVGMGDIDGDGTVGEDDEDLMVSFLLNWDNVNNGWDCSGSEYSQYDMNGDQKCDHWDIFIIYFLIENGYTTPKKNGDVTGEGGVDISDVNAVINIILETKTEADYPGHADLTGDGVVDVSDVNAIINIILAN